MPHGRRRQLVDTGVDLALGQQLHDLLSGVESRTIAERAGVTTGSFFHHFRNRGHFAEAVADRFLDHWASHTERFAAEIEGFNREASTTAFRARSGGMWSATDEDARTKGLQYLLLACREQTLTDDTARTAGDVLARAYASMAEALVPGFERGVRVMGREMLPPFTFADLQVLVVAMFDGMHLRRASEPGALRDDLYVDAVSALTMAVTRPRAERAETAAPELATLESRLVAPPATRTRPATASGTWRHIADAAAHLFVDRSPNGVRVAEVAAAAGVSTSTVYHQFGTVAAVAAGSWVAHMPELDAIATRPLTAGEGPLRRIEQVLTRFVELAKQNRGATEAIVSEVIAESGTGGRGPRPHSIRDLAPLPALVLTHVRELRARGQLRRRVDGERVARSVVHLVTLQTLMFPDDPVERIVDETMGMVFDGTLVVPSDA